MQAGISSFGQDSDSLSAQLVLPENPFIFQEQPVYPIEAGEKYNSADYYSHPDFGRLTFKAPHGKNVVEVLSKRTLLERYYIDLDDPTFFYIEKGSGPINFMKDGQLRAIDPSLHPLTPGVYQSGAQPVPTTLNTLAGHSSMLFSEGEFRFNRFSAKMTTADNSVTVHNPDWSHVTVGNFGAYVTDIFPGIDLKLEYRQAGVKSEFIIHDNPGLKELVFIDHLELPSHWSVEVDNEDPILGLFVQIVNNHTGETEIVFDPARGHDAAIHRNSILCPYVIEGNDVGIRCDSAFLNNPANVYPLIIDPLITAVGPVASAFGIRGSLLSPSSCNHSITVTYPANSTPWDVSADWTVYTDFCARTLVLFGFYDDCWMSDARVWLTSTCGGASPAGAPATTWTCPGCNNIGTWNPSLPFGSSGTQSLAQCFPASCTAQNRTFTLFDNRTYCTTYAPYDNCTWANSYCVSLDQWSITVQGKTMETLGNTTTGNGSQTINDPTCTGNSILDPTPLYGVPAYTYNWSTGATSSTISVPNTPAVYTCTVTDACGVSRVATFNIGCPLPVSLTYFEAEYYAGKVNLEWETLSQSNFDYFIVQRSAEPTGFEDLFVVDAPANSSEMLSYTAIDDRPLQGLNYYRLAIVDQDGSTTYSEVRSILHERTGDELVIIPNPGNGIFELVLSFDEKTIAVIEILNLNGTVIRRAEIAVNPGKTSIPFSYADLPKGVYYLRCNTEKRVLTGKLVIQ